MSWKAVENWLFETNEIGEKVCLYDDLKDYNCSEIACEKINLKELDQVINAFNDELTTGNTGIDKR